MEAELLPERVAPAPDIGIELRRGAATMNIARPLGRGTAKTSSRCCGERMLLTCGLDVGVRMRASWSEERMKC